MSTPQPPKPAKLVISLFMKQKQLFGLIKKELIKMFGPVELLSEWLPFDYTSYYEPEMGKPLFRQMLAFKNLIKQSALADIKNATNELELNFSENKKRTVNIDPGYLLLERFVLGTGKNFTHRIYIGKGIYADLTLIYTKGNFQTLPWTYPDYADQRMIDYLNQVRNLYINDLKSTNQKAK